MKINYRKPVQYELMHGRAAMELIRQFPVGYLPIGCIERHGDHLPMGLDVIKAHKICCIAAQAIGGVVFPPHYYAGIHNMNKDQIAKYTGEWGNIYTDKTAKEHLIDIISQLTISGVQKLVLYTGHYPPSQIKMVDDIYAHFKTKASIKIIPFNEPLVMKGDHAGISETSLMLYLDRALVDMASITQANYRDHGWNDENTPEKADCCRGAEYVDLIVAYLNARINESDSLMSHRDAKDCGL